MARRSFGRECLVRLKAALDLVRPWPLMTRLSPWPLPAARAMGAVVHASARAQGRLSLYEPAWFQMNRNVRAGNVRVGGPWFCLLAENARVGDLDAQGHTLALPGEILTGAPTDDRGLRLSLDFEGAVAFMDPTSAEGRAMNREAARTALDIRRLLAKLRIPSDWHVVGQLFEDPLMDAALSELAADPLVEIGWHGERHPNFFEIDEADAFREVEALERARGRTGLALTAMAFPYNAIGHLPVLVGQGRLTRLRGYVGQLGMPVSVEFQAGFGRFQLEVTSLYLGPHSLPGRRPAALDSGVVNAFLHPEDWIGQDLAPLEAALRLLANRAGN